MKLSVRNKLNIGFTSAIFLVVLVGVISFSTFRKQYKEANLVKHTYKVINQLENIQNLLIDMETGRRGFRSTNEKRFLEPYYLGLENLNASTTDLRRLTADNPIQQEKAVLLVRDISDIVNFWKSLGEDASSYNRDRIIEIMSGEKDKMDKIRLTLTEMMRVENNLLVKREKINENFVKASSAELAIGIFLILCIVILLIIQIIKEFKNRRIAEESVKRNFKELAVVNQENSERNWILAGLAKVNEVLKGHLNIEKLSEQVLDTVIRYLDVKAGAFYIYQEEEKNLVLKAAYALPGSIKREFLLREGLVGQAAVEKEPVLVSSISPDFAKIQGATVAIEPVQAIYLPVYQQQDLKGVIEVLSFKEVGEKHVKLLKLLADNIAVAINEVQARSRKLELLHEVQQQKEILEHQQEELKQTNEELTVQAEVLQASEEELRVQEEELRQINAELKEKNLDVETARQALLLKAKELEASSRFKSEFLANMSHELRTPLNSVLILAKLLADNKEHNLTEKQVAHAKIIHKSGADLLELINDILDLSKIEAGKVDVHVDNIAIKNIAADMEQLFTAVAEEKGIHYTITIEPNVPLIIRTDKQKVEQVLKNLLSNAFKFTPKAGNIELKFALAEEQRKQVVVSVTDTGIGIPAAKQKVIFEAFQQADGSTNRKFGGTGLGLSITKELVRLLGGTINLTSEENKGSTFAVLIPIEDVETETLAIPKNEQELPAAAEAPTVQSRIQDDRDGLTKEDRIMLIIEDDEDFATIIKDFSRRHHYKTIVALSGDEGLHCGKKYKPSAIILDMKLPGIDGLTLIKMFKNDQELKHIPVHIISGSEDAKIASSGALAFLKKPVEREDLENAFTLIGEYLQSAVKRVMILSKKGIKSEVNDLIKEKKYDVVYNSASTLNEAIEKLQKVKYDCIIADIANNIEDGIEKLTQLNERLLPQHIPTIIYLDDDITPANELKLKKDCRRSSEKNAS